MDLLRRKKTYKQLRGAEEGEEGGGGINSLDFTRRKKYTFNFINLNLIFFIVNQRLLLIENS